MEHPGRHMQKGLGAIMPLVGCMTSQVRCQVSRICRQAGYPITPEEADMLMIIRHFDGISQSRLAAILGKDKAAVTRMVNALVKSGLVGREQDQQDRRVVRAYITGQGERAFDKVWPELKKLSDQALQGLSDADVAHICNLLRSINGNLEKLNCSNV